MIKPAKLLLGGVVLFAWAFKRADLDTHLAREVFGALMADNPRIPILGAYLDDGVVMRCAVYLTDEATEGLIAGGRPTDGSPWKHEASNAIKVPTCECGKETEQPITDGWVTDPVGGAWTCTGCNADLS